ncbi:hypothetical protein GTQ99_13255 [Kineococcus sp. T13]|uniref:hypothetical protein n=1 Tax=Kineococcus vitellinus TaxID=2696565 RepID=UPI001412236F|nr:hypothetical protein [Kineococcus vitellinus]NAZ76374.1 hypothetical protein [Kineococcus vitellinus]
MDTERDSPLDVGLLQELLATHGPCGRELEGVLGALWTDPAGDLDAGVHAGARVCVHRGAIAACADLLTAYLREPA